MGSNLSQFYILIRMCNLCSSLIDGNVLILSSKWSSFLITNAGNIRRYSWVNENWAFSRRESCNSRLFECKSRIIFFWELFILSQLLRELHNSQTSSRITKFSPTSPTSRMTFLIIFENYLLLNNFENDFSHHIRELLTSQQLRELRFSSYARTSYFSPTSWITCFSSPI